MTTFLRLLADKDKANNLRASCNALRTGENDERVFRVAPESFRAVPGAPFAYWVSEKLRNVFKDHSAFECDSRTAKQGLATADDGRFLRVWWECDSSSASLNNGWVPLVKGGAPEKFFTDPYAVVKWYCDGIELKSFASWYRSSRGWGDQWSAMINATEYYFRPGFTWPLRASVFAPSAMPAGCAFSTRGCAGIVPQDDLPWLIALMSSHPFDYIFKLRLGRFGYPEFSSGALQPMPVPSLSSKVANELSNLFRSAWSLRRTSHSVDEISHVFALPAALRARLDDYSPPAIEAELIRIQAEIDVIAFDLYGFSEDDRAVLQAGQSMAHEVDAEASVEDDSDDEDSAAPTSQADGLLSWAVGVVSGRFDWRLATGERVAPPEPEPFDPLPTKSPGMLPDGAVPFHPHGGILVDDLGHPHDLPRLVEQVLETVDASVAEDVRRWLQKDFFAFHLKRYSKSRRKAPIYWPLATASGSYTLWLYYPSLSDQTLFTAVNDFVDPKLEDVRKQLQALRDKGAGRSKQDEKSLEDLAILEHELADLRDSLLEIAPNYLPSHDDGVQITAAPLWKLFRHKPWQKVLKDTWAKLEKGDYDWAHLAMNYWPDRVRDKCVTDKSLAIAHGLEHLYVEPEPVEKKTRGRKKAGSTE